MSYVYVILAPRPLATLTRHRPHFGIVDLGGRTAHIRFADSALMLVSDDGDAWHATDMLQRLGANAAAEAGAAIDFAYAKLGRREGEDDAARRIAATTPVPLTDAPLRTDTLYRINP